MCCSDVNRSSGRTSMSRRKARETQSSYSQSTTPDQRSTNSHCPRCVVLRVWDTMYRMGFPFPWDSKGNPRNPMGMFCSVLLPSSIRGLATLWTYFLHLSLSSAFWLTVPRGVLSTSWCCPSRPCVVLLTCVHLALFLALSLSPGNSLVSSRCDHSMLGSLLWRCLTVRCLTVPSSHGNRNTNIPKMGMGRVHVITGMEMTTFFMCAKIPFGRQYEIQSWDFETKIVELLHFQRFAFWLFNDKWQYEILSWDFEATTVECLHFEHLSSFDYSVINIVH